MCTATWLRDGRTFRLWFNRDESRGRPVATAPAVHEVDGVRFLAPRDAAKGGTWIAASDEGRILALLNRSGGVRPAIPGTRGRLIPRWIGAADSFDLLRAVAGEPFDDLPPFRLLAFGFDATAEGRAVIYTWDGANRERSPLESARGLVASSGLGDDTALAVRGKVFRDTTIATADSHRAFHRSHLPERGPFSPCMHHELARTVSHTEIEIDAERVVMRYVDGPPGEPEGVVEVELPRAGVS
jgi:hypothetical protein